MWSACPHVKMPIFPDMRLQTGRTTAMDNENARTEK
jgi:hypothetical protein